MKENLPIDQLFGRGRALRSLEFFPPKTEEGMRNLRVTAEALKEIEPDFVSVTYGAGGSTRERTAQVSGILKEEMGFTVMPHLTCVGHTREELIGMADKLHADGYRNVMALRGDPPKGETGFTVTEGGLGHANELVELLKGRHADFCLGVAGYPDKHPEAVSMEADMEALKRKVDAGAAFVTTQLFFDNAAYFRFVERCVKCGVEVPVVPGVLPAISLKQVERFAGFGTVVPPVFRRRLEAAKGNAVAEEFVGMDWALGQVRELVAWGAPGYHLYILNRASTALSLAAGLAA